MAVSEERDSLWNQMLDAHARGEEQRLLEALPPGERAEAASLLSVADALFEAAHGAPPLSDDPVAAMLGLVPDPQRMLRPEALRRLRSRSRMQPSDVTRMLRARGWDVEVRDVFRWETRDAPDVPPALIEALAEVVGASANQLTSVQVSEGEADDVLQVARRDPRFAGLVSRWANLRGQAEGLAASMLESRILSTVHRGGEPDVERALASLEVFIGALEDEVARRASDD